MKTWQDVAVGWDDNYDYTAADAETLTGGNIILVQDPDGAWQPFVIRQPLTTIGDTMTKTVEAEHLYYELGHGQPKSYTLTNAIPSTAIAGALDGTRWQVGSIDDSLVAVTKDLSGELLNPLQRLRQIESEYEARLRYRYEPGSGLYVDLLEIDNAFKGQRFEFGHNLESVTITADYSEIKTALVGAGMGEEVDIATGEPLPMTFEAVEWRKTNGDPTDKPLGQDWVGDEEARKLYGIPDGNGGMLHRFGVHESDGATPPGVLQGTWTVLQRQARPQVRVDAKVADLEQVSVIDIETGQPAKLSHEKIRLGNISYILARHKGIHAALDVRVSRLERPLKSPLDTRVTLGDPLPLSSQRMIELEQWQRWADRRRRQLDRGKGPATIVIASEDTSRKPWYANIIVPAGATNFEYYFAQALAMLPDKGGQIVIQEGEYIYSGDIVIDRDNVRVTGQGAGTVLRLVDNVVSDGGGVPIYDCNGFFLGGTSGTQISDLTIDGNKQNQEQGDHYGVFVIDFPSPATNFALRNLTITNMRTGGIRCGGSAEAKIEGCTCKGNDGSGISLTGSSEVIVIGNTCNDNGAAGIYVESSTDITIEANTCRRDSSQGIYLFRSQQCSVIANKCYQSFTGSMGVYGGIKIEMSSRNLISNNICSHCGSAGIIVWVDNAEDISEKNIIRGNTCDNGTGWGIAIGVGPNCGGNIVDGNSIRDNAGAGIEVFLFSPRNKISGNMIEGNGSHGIKLYATNNTVQDNTIANNNGYGISIEDNNNFVTNNNLSGNTLGAIRNDATGTVLDPGNNL